MFTYYVGMQDGNRLIPLAKFTDVKDAARLASRWEKKLLKTNKLLESLRIHVWRSGNGSIYAITRWRRCASIETRLYYKIPLTY